MFPKNLSVLSLMLISAATGSAHAAALKTSISRPWKTGQIIAISELVADPTTWLFEAGTGSRYGHVGIVAAENGEPPAVFHANPPAVQKTLLEDFLQRAVLNPDGSPALTVVEPLKPLSGDEKASLIGVLEKMVQDQIPYNFSMVVNPDSVNCSECVHKAFASIKKPGIGEIEELKDMNTAGFDGHLASLWGQLPPLNSPVLTPLSVISSPQVRVVHAALPTGLILSDADVFRAWRDSGGLEAFVNLTDIPRQMLEDLGQAASETPYRDYPHRWRPAP